jgi:hypothetical protein
MVGLLDKIRALGEAAYTEDEMTQAAAERALQIACQCVLDIGNHIIAEKALPLPDEVGNMAQPGSPSFNEKTKELCASAIRIRLFFSDPLPGVSRDRIAILICWPLEIQMYRVQMSEQYN